MANEAELLALLADAKGVIEGLNAIISGEISKEWADFFGKDYEDMSTCLSRITAALSEKDEGGWLPIEWSSQIVQGNTSTLVQVERVGNPLICNSGGKWFVHKPLPPLPERKV